MDPQRDLLAAYFKLSTTEFARCFAAPDLCSRPAIRAHSVQNARVLDIMVSNGHVTALSRRLVSQGPPQVEFTSIGRNKATTFAGLCSPHDQEIFAAIDRAPFDPANPEHLFLVAYRAVLREVHASCAAGWILQTGYRKRVDLGLDPGNVPTDAGMMATRQLIVAYETFNYKLRFDEAFLKKDHATLTHDVIELSVTRPAVAACCLFSIDDAPGRDDVTRACLNILPVSDTSTIVVLSYTKPDAPFARASLDRILSASGHHQAYEISKRLLNSCENFVIAPEHFETWSAEKLDSIRAFYLRTVLKDQLGHDDSALYLF